MSEYDRIREWRRVVTNAKREHPHAIIVREAFGDFRAIDEDAELIARRGGPIGDGIRVYNFLGAPIVAMTPIRWGEVRATLQAQGFRVAEVSK